VIADLALTGADAALLGRLWDVSGSRQTLVARGTYRVKRSGRQVFQLHPNGYRFAPGHVAKLELLGLDEPYSRASNLPWSVGVSNLDLRLPVRDKPAPSFGVTAPAPPFVPPGAQLAR
jgi:hypothetical protein